MQAARKMRRNAATKKEIITDESASSLDDEVLVVNEDKHGPYSQEERHAIVSYIVQHDAYARTGGRWIWTKMESRNVCPGRTWASLREHFTRRILPRITQFKLTQDQIHKFRHVSDPQEWKTCAENPSVVSFVDCEQSQKPSATQSGRERGEKQSGHNLRGKIQPRSRPVAQQGTRTRRKATSGEEYAESDESGSRLETTSEQEYAESDESGSRHELTSKQEDAESSEHEDSMSILDERRPFVRSPDETEPSWSHPKQVIKTDRTMGSRHFNSEMEYDGVSSSDSEADFEETEFSKPTLAQVLAQEAQHRASNAGPLLFVMEPADKYIRAVVKSITPSIDGDPRDVVSGTCRKCCDLVPYSRIKFKKRQHLAQCQSCSSQGVASRLELIFWFLLDLKCADGSLMKVIVSGVGGHHFFNCTEREYISVPGMQEAAWEKLSNVLIQKRLVKFPGQFTMYRPDNEYEEEKIFLSGCSLNSLVALT